MKIFVIGAGYVGLSNAVMLAKHNDVSIIDSNLAKLKDISNNISPIDDQDIKKALKTGLRFNLHDQIPKNITNSDLILICLPTNFVRLKKGFDTSIIETALSDLSELKIHSQIVIRSTLPIGFTNEIQKKFSNLNLICMPEFLREGKALHDCMHPERIVIGSDKPVKNKFINVFLQATNRNCPVIQMKTIEAEAVKLFSNTYLAMRIAFFNELDSFSIDFKMSSKKIIDGMSLDSRIGNYYHNPSFGFGGYCLPKDVSQVAVQSNSAFLPIINTINKSNLARQSKIASLIEKTHIKNIGIYRINMKKDSDNFRESAVIGVIKKLNKSGKKIFIFEPLLEASEFMGYKVLKNFDEFCRKTDVILANRLDKRILKSSKEIISRDIFREN